jgi:hypothetical protein
LRQIFFNDGDFGLFFGGEFGAAGSGILLNRIASLFDQ